VVIAARGGYDAYGLPAVLQTLQAMNPRSGLALMSRRTGARRAAGCAGEDAAHARRHAAQKQLAARFAGAARR